MFERDRLFGPAEAADRILAVIAAVPATAEMPAPTMATGAKPPAVANASPPAVTAPKDEAHVPMLVKGPVSAQ